MQQSGWLIGILSTLAMQHCSCLSALLKVAANSSFELSLMLSLQYFSKAKIWLRTRLTSYFISNIMSPGIFKACSTFSQSHCSVFITTEVIASRSSSVRSVHDDWVWRPCKKFFNYTKCSISLCTCIHLTVQSNNAYCWNRRGYGFIVCCLKISQQ